MLINIVIIIGTHLIVPLLLIWGLWRGEFKSRTSWLATMLGSGAYTLYFFLAGAGWYWVSVNFRWAIPAVFLVATVVSLRRTWRADVPWWRNPGSPNGWALLATNAFLALLFGGVSLLAAQGYSYEDSRAVELSFPLRGGVWHVVHGGNGPMLNYHNVDPAQRFALDVVRLNPLGTRASGIYPSDPARYAAFGQKIYSPCAGEVIGTKAGQPDHRISGTDRENPAGNHVVVRCGRRSWRGRRAGAHDRGKRGRRRGSGGRGGPVLGPGRQLRQHLGAPSAHPRREDRLGVDPGG